MSALADDSMVAATFASERDLLVRRVASRLRDRAAAEDIVQEAFSRLTRAVRSGRPPNDLGGWTYRVAMNLAASHGRRLQVERRHAREFPIPVREPSPDEVAEAHDLKHRLDDAVGSLPPAYRMAVLLAANGFPGSAVAARLARSDAATRTLLCRARARIRAELDG